MNAIVIEHVSVAELPAAWRARLDQAGNARVTVRIEAEDNSAQEAMQNPLFGMWRDREDLADVAGYIRRIRAPRFGSDNDGSSGS
jgi:hypothetical protein